MENPEKKLIIFKGIIFYDRDLVSCTIRCAANPAGEYIEDALLVISQEYVQDPHGKTAFQGGPPFYLLQNTAMGSRPNGTEIDKYYNGVYPGGKEYKYGWIINDTTACELISMQHKHANESIPKPMCPDEMDMTDEMDMLIASRYAGIIPGKGMKSDEKSIERIKHTKIILDDKPHTEICEPRIVLKRKPKIWL